MMGEIVSEYHLWLLLLTQGTACLALGLAGSFALKHHASRAHQVLLIALLASVFMPAAYLGVRHFELGVLAAEAPSVTEEPLDPQPPAAEVWTEAPEVEVVEPARVAVETPVPARVPSVDIAQVMHLPWRMILLACWAIAVVVLATRLALRFLLGVFLLRNARPVDAVEVRQALDEACERVSVTGPVSVWANREICSPVIWCWSRVPALLVPTDALSGIGVREWVGVFCHELAHLKRRDHVTAFFAELLVCLAPWHPLLWWVRKRLLRFSEEACDDWVLAGGQIGVDYAESLLELSPQRQLAFMPTVIGKEKTMKARIRRIVQEKCGNPHIGRRWGLIVILLVLGLTVGVAFAQRRAAPRTEVERQEQRELMIAGRRNVLSRLLEQLVAQSEEIEAALRERGDDPGADGHVMRAELDALREHIGIVERQLHNLERRERPRPEQEAPEADLESLEAHIGRLNEVREQATENVHQIEMELRELGDRHPEIRQPEVREELEGVLRREHGRLETLTREQERLERRRAQIAPRNREERRRDIDVRVEELGRRRDELADRAGHLEIELKELREGPPEPREHVEQELRTVLEQLEALSQEQASLRRSRRRTEATRTERERARVRDTRERTRELSEQLHELQRRARVTERNLDFIEDKDSSEAREERAKLDRAHEEMARVEQELSRLHIEATRAEAERATRSTAARATSQSRRASVQAPRREENLRRAHEGLLAQIRMTEEKLKAAREEDGPAAERLQRQLEQLHERRASLEREARPPADAPRDRSARDPDMERQVEELRGKVDGMHQEMAQMREMLQQLLEQTRREPPALLEMEEEEVQEFREY